MADMGALARQLSFEKKWHVQYGASWQHVHAVCDITTIADFWGFFSNIGMPTTLPAKGDLYLFHSGNSPKWEAPENRRGGKWDIDLKTERTALADTLWTNILLGLVGEQFECGSSDVINGVTLNVRPKGLRVSVWTREAPIGVQLRVGESIRRVAEIPPSHSMVFKWHEESLSKGSAFAAEAAGRV